MIGQLAVKGTQTCLVVGKGLVEDFPPFPAQGPAQGALLTSKTQITPPQPTLPISTFKDLGITLQAVMTDNGACYRSRAFNQVLSVAGIKHRYTRPYRPQTNGKVERFNRTLAREWAYAHTYTSQTQREAAYQTWLHHYNHHRPHTALNGQTPASRIHNLTGKYT